MRLIEFWTRVDMTRLDELFIRYKTPGVHTDYHLIAHRENIWLYNREDMDNEQLVADIQQRTGLTGDDLDDLSQQATDRGDLITGVYHASRGEFWHQGDPGYMTHNPVASQYFKKLIAFLGVDVVQGNRFTGMDDTEVETMRHEMEGRIPDEMYHGTNTDAIPRISKLGLAPGEGEGNWDEVGQFEDMVFLTQDYYNAKFHAERQSRELGKGAPVILKVKIPDRTKIVPDFDMATQMGGKAEEVDELGYSGANMFYDKHVVDKRDELAKYNPGSDLTMISGIVGYKGRIPANHITEIHAALAGEMGDPDNLDYHEFNSWKEFDEALNIYQDYGYWYPGIEEEFRDEEEQEDEDY